MKNYPLLPKTKEIEVPLDERIAKVIGNMKVTGGNSTQGLDIKNLMHSIGMDDTLVGGTLN